MKKIFCFLILAIATTQLHAQQPRFITEGRLEFEKKINMYSMFEDDDDPMWLDEYKKNNPQFKTLYFDLFFTDTKSLFKPGRENPEASNMWTQPSEDNVVYTDFSNHSAISMKNVFEKTFLVSDSARTIRWKITDEKRTIAGFECRRANAVIMDSIYVVAFYTDEISTTGGPESFNGLPGMILGLAIPHEHVTWFATKLYLTPVKESDIKAPQKGVKSTNASMKEYLQSNTKRWGKWGRRYVKAAMI